MELLHYLERADERFLHSKDMNDALLQKMEADTSALLGVHGGSDGGSIPQMNINHTKVFKVYCTHIYCTVFYILITFFCFYSFCNLLFNLFFKINHVTDHVMSNITARDGHFVLP